MNEVPREVLVPYTEFDPTDLAQQLHDLVRSNETVLRQRHLEGTIARYGTDIGIATEKVRKGQGEQDRIGHYAVMAANGSVVGSASIYPELELHKLRIPLPPALAVGPLSVAYPYANPNIHAWVDQEVEFGMLSRAYAGLLALVQPSHRNGLWETTWTIEPRRSPASIHDAIIRGGLRKVVTRRFDDGESRHHIPPRSTLYVKNRLEHLHVNHRGLLRDLRSGVTWNYGGG